MPVTLQSLSAELLDSIISFCDNKTSLVVLARTSKHLCRLALPYLYRDISLSYSYEYGGTMHLRSLALTMLQKPEIAALARSFTIRSNYSTAHTAERLKDKPELIAWQQHPDLDRLLRNAIGSQLAADSEAAEPPGMRAATEEAGKNRQGIDRAEQWLQIARTGHNEASILALLLPSLVNLQLLDVPFTREWRGASEDDDTHYIEDMLRYAGLRRQQSNGRPVFDKLTDVMIAGVDDKYPDDPTFFGWCTGLPAIKRLFGANQGDEDDYDDDTSESNVPFDRLGRGSSSLELIHLRHSKLNSFKFLNLMHAPKCLKTLIYEIGNTWAWTKVQFPQLQLALNAQRECLERLCLSHAPFYPYQDDIDEMTPMTFREFSALKHFRVAPIYIYGDERLGVELGDAERDPSAQAATEEEVASTRTLFLEVLPRQLETFGLLYCNDSSALRRILLGLEEMLACKDEQFPQLREVSIHGQNDTNLKEMLEKFTGLPWKAKGVHFVVKRETGEDQSGGNDKVVQWGWDEEVEWAECYHAYCGVTEVLYDSMADDAVPNDHAAGTS